MIAAVDNTNHHSAAEQRLQTFISKQLGFDVKVKINKGFSLRTYKPGASEDAVEIIATDDRFKQLASEQADSLIQGLLKQMHTLYSLRDNAIFLSPQDYLAFGAEEMKYIQDEAAKAGITLEGIDLSKSIPVRSNFSNNQKRQFAAKSTEDSWRSAIRIQIPTDPNNLEAAETLAQKVAADIEKRLPEIKSAMIARIKKKNYRALTPEQEQALQNHEFKVVTQQQEGNWTSVFIELRSPEQVRLRDHPEEKPSMTPEQIKNTNMLMYIENADQRAKLAARAALFQGPDMNKPASYFTDVAGVGDIKNLLGKTIHYLLQKNPDPNLAKRAASLMKENFLISPEEWNVSHEQQSTRKQLVSANIEPGKNELKIKMYVPMGKADEIFTSLAALPDTMIASENKTSEIPAAGTNVTLAGAGKTPEGVSAAGAANVTVCTDPNHAAVSASGAATDGNEVGAVAGGACVNKNTLTPESLTAAMAAAGGTDIRGIAPKSLPAHVTPQLAASFLEKVKASKTAGTAATTLSA